MKRVQQLKLFFLFVFFLLCAQGCEKSTEKIILNQMADTAESFEVQTRQSKTAIAKENISEAENISEPQTIAVYVCGEVNFPGVYILEEGSRLYQAVEAAGGMTGEAYAEAVNLARVLSDAEQIRIPDISQKDIIEEVQASSAVSGVVQEENSDELININQATVTELMQLPGIGEVKAEAIAEYRASNGLFETIDEIKNVPGIKEAAFEKIKELITVF